MKVTVYYDYNCPFCFVGINRLAILEKEFPLEIESKGFEIHPEIPSAGIKRSKTIKFQQIFQNITEISQEDGSEIKLPGIIANSRLSLEASEFAKTKNKFNEFHKVIYQAYFQNDENIGNRDVILKAGEDAGLDVVELEDCLDRRTMHKKIEENRQEAEKNQVFGVPAFLLGNFLIHGVQSLVSFRSIINRAIERKPV